nr:hypothetical protein [uncultured Dyadobacter sp.]
MDIYKNYLDNIREALTMSTAGNTLNESIDKSFKSEQIRLLADSAQANPMPSLMKLSSEWNLQPALNQKLGLHPDFEYLKKTLGFEEHYIHSMFIDIKRSTNLFKRYSPLVVAIITNTVQRAAIHTCMMFGGYVHRLHGDGTFVYFGGRNQTPKESIHRCLQAASLFSHFMKTDLRGLFEAHNIEPIYTRIGIDYGDDKHVIWTMAGVGEVSEVTTCSLHTSLAPKMQAHAEGNGIVVGDNILKLYPTEFYSPVCHRPGKEKFRYIFTDPDNNFYYTQHDFNWQKFLKASDKIVTNALTGEISIKPKQVLPSATTSALASIASTNRPYYDGEPTA